jgi:hypothetical protein
VVERGENQWDAIGSMRPASFKKHFPTIDTKKTTTIRLRLILEPVDPLPLDIEFPA